MFFLGTGAAEMYPNPYCDCNVCMRVRNNNEKPRLQSAFLIDSNNLIDFGTTVLAESSLYNIRIDAVENIFITHTHSDHFSIENIESFSMADKRNKHVPLNFYMSEKAYDWFMKYLDLTKPLSNSSEEIEELINANRICFHKIKPYTSFIVDNMNVFSVESNHRVNKTELSVNYLFDRGEQGKLLYVLDSGIYTKKNLEVLKNAGVDVLIMEGTFGSLPVDPEFGHLNAEHFIQQTELFSQYGIIKKDTRIYVTHINQCNTFNHAEYQKYLNDHSKHNIIVASDGMEIES
jgi:phosphoribosyl 1,2-cyclic phosphate phosphodiesterase